MRRFAFELETAVHAPNRLHQRIEHFVFQRAEQRHVEFSVRFAECARVFPALADISGAFAHIGDVFAAKRLERLTHVAQFQHFANAEHLAHTRVILRIAHIEKQHVLKDEIQIEVLDLRAASGAGLHHAHQLHALDGLAQHVAADPPALAHGLFRGEHVARLQTVVNDITADFAKGFQIQLFRLFHAYPPIFV